MTKKTIACAVLFADVVGSTRLYDRLGDTHAQLLISRRLSRLSDITAHHGGVVIKNIGDEIMCRFDSAPAAVYASCDMQEWLRAHEEGEGAEEPSVPIHVGIHYGPAIVEGGDLFGDAVNVAARMTSIARAGQIIVTKETVEQLPNEQKLRVREFDRAPVKGKHGHISVYEVVWEDEDVTRMVTFLLDRQNPVSSELVLRFRQKELLMGTESEGIALGRGGNCNLVMDIRLASRMHARFEYRRGKFVLLDQSTNGTYVRIEDGKEVYLRREELSLWGDGAISLGQPVVETPRENLLFFHCK
jgi:class 3 adenylate cyclase